jgi:hypothetical protein
VYVFRHAIRLVRAGSQRQSRAQTLKVTTHLVVLNVVVTDKKGNPVTDLTKEDFKVFENEQLQAIATFEPAAQPATAEGEHASPAFIPPVAMQNGAQPTTILVLDELNVHGEDVMFAAEKLKKFLQAHPAVLAQTTSLYLLNKRKLELYGTPTRNRDALLAVLKKTLIELAPHDLESSGAQGASDRLLASMIALGEIALANADHKVRKNVIWIGNGKFRKIRIGVARQELQARTQRGYYAFADGVENNGDQLDWSISRAVTSPLLFNGIGVTATGKRIAPGPAAGKKSKSVAGAASVLLAINRDSRSWTTQPNGDERSEATLVTSEMSSSERVLGYHVREVEVVVEKAKVGSSDKVELTVRTEVPARTDHIRLVLRDASSGRLGTS